MSSWLIRYILRQSPVLGYRTRPPQNTKAVSIASPLSVYSKTVCWTQGRCDRTLQTLIDSWVREKKVSVVDWWSRHTEHP